MTIKIRRLKYRWLVVALALLAASSFALSVQAGRWWRVGDVEIGPGGAHRSFGDAVGMAWAGGGPRWERFGAATWAGGLIAMFVLVVMAGALAARRVPRLAALTALVAIGTVGATGIGFIAMRPDGLPFAVGPGIYWFVTAVAVGVAAALPVARRRST